MIRLTVVRKDMGVTQKQLAKTAKINEVTICQVEKGWVVPCPSWKKKIAEALNYPDIEGLFGIV